MLRCGLLGKTLGHSYSPQIHAELGGYAYKLYEKAPGELEDFLKSGSFDGLNVTIPYKKTVVPYCAALSDTARALGSVNTLVRRPDGTLRGDNTDFFGFTHLVRASGVSPAGKKALVFGSGGASATVTAALAALGASPVVISRHGPDNYGNLGRHRDAQLVVNTTPVGMDEFFAPNNGLSISAQRFTAELRARGHDVRVLAGDVCGVPEFPLPEFRVPIFDGLIKRQGMVKESAPPKKRTARKNC